MFDFETLAEPSQTISLDKQDLLPGMMAGSALAVQTFTRGQDCQVTDVDATYHGQDQTTVMRWPLFSALTGFALLMARVKDQRQSHCLLWCAGAQSFEWHAHLTQRHT